MLNKIDKKKICHKQLFQGRIESTVSAAEYETGSRKSGIKHMEGNCQRSL